MFQNGLWQGLPVTAVICNAAVGRHSLIKQHNGTTHDSPLDGSAQLREECIKQAITE